ncbi:hypothetical protein RND81_11G165100 [Saponaria officinalis]|uniref:Uncharacterized protein n=1 Tax=Saponaria officinalis TaxID=3572 RepID=A0AAW1HLZ5_SAPOF
MSGGEHTNNDPAQFGKINEVNAGCTNDKQVEPYGNKEHCDLNGSKSVSSSLFDSSGEKLPVYSNAVGGDGRYGSGGDITNWDVGQCFGEGLNSVQTVGEVFDIFGTSFQDSEQPGMGNNLGNINYAARQQDHGNVVSTEQMPVSGGESMGCEPEEDGSKGTCLVEKIRGNSLGGIGTEVGEPHRNNYHDAMNEGGGGSNCGNEMIGGKSSSTREVETKTFEPAEVGSWKLIDEIARQCVENVGCILTECDQNMLSHESQTGEPSRVLNGVECIKSEMVTPGGMFPNSVKSDIVGGSLNPEDKVVELSSQLHFQKDCPAEDSFKNVDGKHDEPINASDVVSDDARFVELSKNQEKGVGVSVHGDKIEQKENVTSEAGQDNVRKQQTYATEPVGKSRDDIGKHSSEIVKVASTAGDDNKASLNEQSRQFLQIAGGKAHAMVLSLPATDPSPKPFRFRSPPKAKKASGKSRRGQNPKGFSAAKTERSPGQPSAASSREAGGKSRRVRKPKGFSAAKTERSPGQPSAASSREAGGKSRRVRKPKGFSAAKTERSPGQPSAASSRVLRPKLQEKPITPESTSNLLNTQGSSVERRGRKSREMTGKSYDEFTKMRKNLRYLLQKINYEQSLLDAYSNEGWRGQSLEKLRPEKELQRAKTDINRFKVKIRELFHRLDTMSCEGKFPDSLYDSEGLIDSEDIFCAKCGSKDLLAGNDIILCDGSCDRGFHQYCLEPPLRTEEIPPGDEGWFCPACDCKFDCFDLLNDCQGVKLSIEDSWEKVFPEAVAAMSGLKQDDLMGLPSDDSEDDDFNPDDQDDGSKEAGKEINSDESDSDESDSSDFSSASEDLGAVRKDDQYLGLPSDDSEDDDFNPDAANSNDDGDEGASSCSDFTSASGDLGATVGNDVTSENGHSLPAVLDEDLGESTPPYAKRQIERLDYKKLFDETYGNAVSDSSDDEEWTDDNVTTRTKTSAKREVSVSANGDMLTSADDVCPEVTPRRRGGPKRDHQVEKGSPDELQKTPQETSSGSKRGKKLPESVTQRLYESFKENMYPDRSTKEKLAGELGLTPARVDKWFGNARWSFHHHPSRVEAIIARVVPGIGTPQTLASADTNITVPERGDASTSKLDKRTNEQISTRQETSKRKAEDDELQASKVDTSKAHDSLETPEAHGRGQRKRRKSNAGRG